MALRRMLSEHFLHLTKHHSSTRAATLPLPPPDLRRRWISQSIRNPLPIGGDNLIERIRSSMMLKDRIQIDAFPPPPSPVKEMEGEISKMAISVPDLRKLIKASRIEAARTKLRGISSSYVPYSKFAEIYREAADGSDESAREIQAALDHSGTVIVLADLVFLRPDQVARAIESVITAPQPIISKDDAWTNELKEMEAEKAIIDKKAETQVKRELWAGLGLVLIQTAGFMRLTFWELSWDVMEPICFFTTSVYFMLGYAFFLRTAKEPSFEGLFSSRFATKQKRLMKSHSFDLPRFNDLKRALTVHSQNCNACSARL